MRDNSNEFAEADLRPGTRSSGGNMGIEAVAQGLSVETSDDLVGALRARLAMVNDMRIAVSAHTMSDVTGLLDSCAVDIIVVDGRAWRADDECMADESILRVAVLTRQIDGDETAECAHTPPSKPSSVCAALSRREVEVLRAVASGGTAQAAATELSLSPHTVRNHLSRVLAKLDVHTALEAVVVAIREQMIDVSDVGGRRVS